jgi:tetratricopeptide (TPR) repeat protein
MMIQRALPFVLLLMGCAAQRTASWFEPELPFGAVSAEILNHMVERGDRAFASRDTASQLDEAMELWGGALRYRPADPAILVRLSHAARLRAHSAPSGDAATLADQAIGFAERALSVRNPRLRTLANDKKSRPAQVFAAAELADLPALTAYAEALLDWCDRKGLATLLSQRDWLMAAAERALQLDRTADFGAADRILGVVEARLTPDLGGDLKSAEEHFEAALAEAPRYLPARLQYAETWCVRMREEPRYTQLLHEVADADPAALPEAAPENRDAQRRARELLKEGRGW